MAEEIDINELSDALAAEIDNIEASLRALDKRKRHRLDEFGMISHYTISMILKAYLREVRARRRRVILRADAAE